MQITFGKLAAHYTIGCWKWMGWMENGREALVCMMPEMSYSRSLLPWSIFKKVGFLERTMHPVWVLVMSGSE
jgi:hypothetical protein